ncbi:E3 ubiquitin-protein ligase RAD18 isoform X2 [Lampris incognitus]|uniref:E3 ubiquitin-protein ligase RAD18 isoform X2 n=1 Tax=Lampris incognitus TaxID=2546036 RepID=UPI0024B4E8F7|nr:E3 ubiquitin-protein ligase RAD18 isoform X2 [Lampris incognitus]
MPSRDGANLPPSLACFKNVEALLRCPICFEYLGIAMMTKCSHNFCSLCIRRFLAYKLQCPVCNLETTQQDLRNNRLLDDLVVNFQEARQQSSKANFESPPVSPVSWVSEVRRRTPRDGSILSHFFQGGPKKSPTQDTQRVGLLATSVAQGEMQTARTHATNDVDLHSPTAPPLLGVKEEPVEEEVVMDLASVKAEEMDDSFSAQQPSKSDSPLPSADIKPVSKVECPVCSVGVSQQFINKHLDICLTRGEKKESLRSPTGGKRCPMGKLVYTLLSLPELKRKLKECHLSIQGTRDQLTKRHQEFVLSYNAQCDSLNPKSAREIAREVEANEKTRNQLQGNAKPVMPFSKNQSEEELEEMHSNYRKKHSSEFARLIAQVRSHQKMTRQTPIKGEVSAEGDEAQAAQTTDRIVEWKDSTVSERCLPTMSEETEVDELASAGEMPISASHSYSDVSISRELENITVRKRRPRSRHEDVAPPVIRGKRRRKTLRREEGQGESGLQHISDNL